MIHFKLLDADSQHILCIKFDQIQRDVYKQATIFLTNVEIGNKGMITWASFALVMQQLIAVCNTTVLKIK